MKGAGLSFSRRTVSGLLTTSWLRRRQPAPRPARHPGGRAGGVHTGVHRCPYPWDVLGGLAFGASVALLGWLLLGRPLTGLASRPRRQPGLNVFFAEHEGSTPLPIPASCRLSMTGLINQILSAPTWTVLAMVALIVFVEDALFVGFVIPGETAAIVGGVAASLGHAPLAAVVAVVIAAAIVGDSVGYEVGRQMGPRILGLSILNKRRKRLDDAQDFLARRGGAAVFLGCWVAFFSAVMPTLAGTARMPYPKFLASTPPAASCGAPPQEHMFWKNVGMRGSPAPVRAYLPDLLRRLRSG